MLPYEEVKIKSEALIESHVKIIKGVNFVATDIDKIKTAVRNEAILHSISSQQGVVDAYSQSANEVINSQTDYKSILKLRDESQQIIDHLKSL